MQLPENNSVPLSKPDLINLNALNDYLLEEKAITEPIIEITQYPGGFSNLTFSITTRSNEFVLRRPPFGTQIKSAHDMGREFNVLSALQNVYTKIPKPIVYCTDENVIGAPFYVMQKLQGIILRATNAPKLNLPATFYRQASEALVDNLVQLHQLDIFSSGLINLGKPEGYIQRQVEGWIKRYYAAQTDVIKNIDTIAEWLGANQPPTGNPSFIHNDYKYDNVVLNPENPTEIVGVLDWEMSTVGDPLMDLGATLAYWSEALDSDEVKFFNLTWLPGNLTRQEVVDRYTDKTGNNISNIMFYYLFGLFKNAVIAQQIYKRWKDGYSNDKRFAGLLPIIEGLGTRAINSLETNKL